MSGVDAESWRRCDRLHEMYEIAAGRAGPRKLRLFAAACCRRVLPWLPAPLARAALDVAERHADGAASDDELAAAELAAFASYALERERPAVELDGQPPWSRQALMATRALSLLSAQGLYQALDCAAHARMVPPGPHGRLWEAEQAEEAAQCELLREVLGPAAAPRFDAAWPLANGLAARRLAEVIYAEGAWELMPILGDALEEAGCAEEEILGHARGEKGHVRGCWVVDLVLGRT